MDARKKIAVLVVLGGVLGAALGAGIVSLCHRFGWQLVALCFMERGSRDAHQQRVRFLSRTDHRTLLDAGREILKQLPHGYLDGHHPTDNLPIPEGVAIPQVMRDLGRIWVRGDGFLTVDMHGGMDHFGFSIYPEGFEQLHPMSTYGNRKIIDGLWYYDDGYIYDPNYDQVIDAILHE